MRHSKDDAKWIKEQLDRLPYRYQLNAKDGYDAVYSSAYDEEVEGHKKENRARHAANTRLRKYVDKMLALN